jgi:UDP-glucuronate 4-epimerase
MGPMALDIFWYLSAIPSTRRTMPAEKKVLVTGAAGFIGFHLCRRLLAEGHAVVGVDNLCDYYPVQLKKDRLAALPAERFCFEEFDLVDPRRVEALFAEHEFTGVVHLAAKTGVRYSLENPAVYLESNVVATGRLLEACRGQQTPHLVYASSSSVYGANRNVPFSVDDPVDHPISLYAATKRSCELMAHTYSHLFGLPTTGLRLFTVYGPWGRSDMAIYKFSELMRGGKPIDVFNDGKMERDFTFVDDVVEGIVRVLAAPPRAGEMRPSDRGERPPTEAPSRLYNLGNHRPESLEKVIALLEGELGVRAERRLLPLQPGDMLSTCADNEPLALDFDFRPTTTIEEGIRKFVAWFREY